MNEEKTETEKIPMINPLESPYEREYDKKALFICVLILVVLFGVWWVWL